MATKSSTYTNESGAQETVTLTRGPGTPRGHALLIIDCNDDQYIDCYVNTAWLRDRLDDLGEPRRTAHRPLTPDAITDEMIERGAWQYVEEGYVSWRQTPETVKNNARESVRGILRAALTEPPARPEGAERFDPVVDAAIRGYSDITSPDVVRAISDAIAEDLIDPTRKEA